MSEKSIKASVSIIENNLKDILNVTIGLVRQGEESLQKNIKSISSNFEQFKKKGAEDKSESAKKVRELLNNSLENLSKLSVQTADNAKSIYSQIDNNYSQVIDKVRSTIGEEQCDKLTKTAENLYKNARKKTEEMQNEVHDFISRIRESSENNSKAKTTVS